MRNQYRTTLSGLSRAVDTFSLPLA